MKLDVSSDESSDEDEEADAAAEGTEGGDEGSAAGKKTKATAAAAATPVPQDVLDNVSRLKNEGPGLFSPLLSCSAEADFSPRPQRYISPPHTHTSGNTYFRGEEYGDAAEVYTEALEALQSRGSAPVDESRLLGNRAGKVIKSPRYK